MTTYFAIADLHGRYGLLECALEDIADYIRKNKLLDYKIITLGDYIDRGPQSRQIIERLMKLQDFDVISLQGNHEDMAVQTLTGMVQGQEWWVGNGGGETLRSYGSTYVLGQHYDRVWNLDVVPEEHIKWMAMLPLTCETEKQVFVHAGIPNNSTTLKEQDEERLIWMLYGKNDSGGWQGKHVVHGHHQFADGPHTWEGPNGGRTDLDTFAWYTGRLVVGVFDDTQGPAIDFIEVTE